MNQSSFFLRLSPPAGGLQRLRERQRLWQQRALWFAFPAASGAVFASLLYLTASPPLRLPVAADRLLSAPATGFVLISADPMLVIQQMPSSSDNVHLALVNDLSVQPSKPSP